MNELDVSAQSTLLGLGNAQIQAEAREQGVRDPKAISFAKVVAARAVADSTYSRDQKIAANKANELNEQFKKDIMSGKATFFDGERYAAKLVTGATGLDEILDSSQNAKVGITNFEEARMPNNSNLLLAAMAIEYGQTTAASGDDNPDQAEYGNIFDAGGNVPLAILNAEIEVKSGGEVILPYTSVSKFFGVNGAALGDAQGRRVVQLSSPKLIKGGDEVQITLKKPDNGGLTAENDFIKVSLIGPEIMRKR